MWGKRGWERKLVLIRVSIVKHHNQKLLGEERAYFSLYFQHSGKSVHKLKAGT